MSTAPFEIIAGPADIYIAPAIEVPPSSKDPSVTPAGNWVSLGRTEGGITVTHEETIELLRVDQASGPVKGIRTEEGLVAEFSMAELTLERYAEAINKPTVTDVGTHRWIPLRQGFDVTRFSLLIRGDSPYVSGNAQYYLPICVQNGTPAVSFTREDKSVLEVAFAAIEDPAAATVGERFGHLSAMDT